MPFPFVEKPNIGGCVPLTPAQAAVLAGVASGLCNEQIATWLGIGLTTVETRLGTFSEQTGISRRSEVTFAYPHRECCIAHLVAQFPPLPSAIARCHSHLPPRVCQSVELLAAGFADDEIARVLGEPQPTTRTRFRRLFRRLSVSRRAAVLWAILHLGCCYAASDVLL